MLKKYIPDFKDFKINEDAVESEQALNTITPRYETAKVDIEKYFEKYQAGEITKEQYMLEFDKFLEVEMEYKRAKAEVMVDTGRSRDGLGEEKPQGEETQDTYTL